MSRYSIASQARSSFGKRIDRDLRFGSREVGAEAVMNSSAEGEMLVAVAGDIEAVRVGKSVGVAIAGADQNDDVTVAGNLDTSDGDVLQRAAAGGLNGAVVTQAFLDRAGQEVRLTAQAFHLIAMLH